MARMTTATNANLLLDVFHANSFVEALRETTVALQFGRKQEAPRNSGDVIRWQYFSNPSAATTALGEGNDPTSPTDLSTNAVTATMLEYGAYFEPSKVLTATAASGTMQEIVEAAGYQAGITVDTLCYTLALQDATNINSIGGNFTLEDLRAASAELHTNSARPNPATSGGKYYAALLSSESYFDMHAEDAVTWANSMSTDFYASRQTPSSDKATPDGIAGGSAFGCQTYVSQNIQVDANDDDLNYLVAKDAFGCVSLDSDVMDPRVIITNPEDRVDKPLRNSGTVGWWVYWAAELIDANRVVEILSNRT